MTSLQFLALSLGTFRLTRLITDDKITDWFRSLVIRKSPQKIKAKAKEGITCPFCVSFYLAVIFTCLAWQLGWIIGHETPVWGSAIWGTSILLNQLFCYLTEKSC
jgi:hypothetical protein